MAAAVVQAQIGTGGSAGNPTWANAETGIKFNREATATGTTPIPIPTATGTHYSWIKNLALVVTTAGTTSISNRNISMSGACATGLQLMWKTVAVASYVVPASGNMPADDTGGNLQVAAGYTLMTTSPAQYDNASVSTAITPPLPNGSMAVVILGVGNTFAGGPGSATTVPSIILN